MSEAPPRRQAAVSSAGHERSRGIPPVKSGRPPSRKASARSRRVPSPGTSRASGGTEAAIAALREDVAALGRAVAAQTEAIERLRLGAPAGTPGDLVSRLSETARLLSTAAADLPRVDDFLPLADHLYAFAQSAPRLLESLEAVRVAVGPLEAAARSLAEVADTLVATHHAWAESLLRLPRAEDYEPLTVPLREFARVSPLLAETLGAVVKAVTPLPGMVRQVLGGADAMRAAPVAAAPADGLRGPLADAADRMASARATILAGLSSLPRDRAYAEAAAHLRELATVSPSLMEWLRQLPAITEPLGEALAALTQAATELEDAERAARRAIGPGPRAEQGVRRERERRRP